ncbi:hypothetical protein GYMLUDRAFT_34539 [Collybiopsis luxurians FD-317 M1]|nr:hypothetical protein GYMLUDRAFT_34539 [Collybiopsis luxurians FD-317 M1]
MNDRQFMSSSHRSSGSTNSSLHSTSSRQSEPSLLAAPSSFKHTIDLPPDDFPSSTVRAEDFEDDDDVEMQRYLEQIYMMSKSESVNSEHDYRIRQSSGLPGSAGDSGLGGLGLIDISPVGGQSPYKTPMTDRLKGEGSGRDNYRMRSRDTLYNSGGKQHNSSASSSSSYHATTHNFGGRNGRFDRDVGLNNITLNGFDTFSGRDSVPDELDDLDIALVLPEEQWYGSQPRYTDKGKGRSRDAY